jgi:hypothetical protein
MAGLVPAIHVVVFVKEGLDARIKPGYDAERSHFSPTSLLYDA